MLGFNGGLAGKLREPTSEVASGLWFPNEQSVAQRDGIWPSIPPLAPTDPDFANVSLLLHMDGSNGSTTFTDSSSNALTVTANGNAQISTAQSKFDGASGYFDGAGDSLSVASNEAFNLSNDFTIEFWMYQDATSVQTYPIVFERGTENTVANYGFILDNDTGGGAFFYGNPRSYVSIPSLAIATWHHLAIARSGSTVRTFVGGILQSSETVTNDFTSSALFRIGTASSGSFNAYKGYVDDFRITKGIARYTANFSPPTAAFPNS